MSYFRKLAALALPPLFALGMALLGSGCVKSATANLGGQKEMEMPSGATEGQSFTVTTNPPAGNVAVTGLNCTGCSCSQTSTNQFSCQALYSGQATCTANFSDGSSNSASLNITLPPNLVSNDKIVALIQQGGSNGASVSASGASSTPEAVMNTAMDFSLVAGSVLDNATSVTADFGDSSATQTISFSGSLSGLVFHHTYLHPGQKTVTFSASNPNGPDVSLSFNMLITCDSSINPVQIASLSVSPLDHLNDFTYTVTLVANTGSGDYTLSVSPDGTGVYRQPAAATLTPTYFADYDSSRAVKVILQDLACGNQVSAQITYNYGTPANGTTASTGIPTSDGNPGPTPVTQSSYRQQGPQVGNHIFIQGEISPVNSSSTDARINGFLSLLKNVGPMRLTTEYNAQGGNDSKSNPSLNPYPGSFNQTGFTGNNISNPGTNGDGISMSASFDANGNLTISQVIVSISGNSELGNLLQDSYSTTPNTPACTGYGIAYALVGYSPCDTGQTGANNLFLGWHWDATYSCPELVDSNGNEISIIQGALMGEDKVGFDCSGGGQGGGGVPPFSG
jgi:hypothetical protein